MRVNVTDTNTTLNDLLTTAQRQVIDQATEGRTRRRVLFRNHTEGSMLHYENYWAATDGDSDFIEYKEWMQIDVDELKQLNLKAADGSTVEMRFIIA